MLVWPFVLTALMLFIGRFRKVKPDARGLLLLSAIAIVSHPLLDLMNTYGVRLLMPFSERWFYGDTLFIIDPWLWLMLFVGIVLARRAQRAGSPAPFRPMRVALGIAGAYVGMMMATGIVGRGIARRALEARGLQVQRLMVSPLPLNPLARDVVASAGPMQVWGTLRLEGTRVRFREAERYPKRDDSPEARAASATVQGRRFLAWARFPYFLQHGGCPPAHTCILDLRYPWQGWATVAVPVGRAVSSSATPPLPEQP